MVFMRGLKMIADHGETQMTYFVAVNGKALWIATMPMGTKDRAFALKVSASIPGSSVISQ